MAQPGTGRRYGIEDGRGELSVWGGIISARHTDYAGALNTTPEGILEVARREENDPMLTRPNLKGREATETAPTNRNCGAWLLPERASGGSWRPFVTKRGASRLLVLQGDSDGL